MVYRNVAIKHLKSTESKSSEREKQFSRCSRRSSNNCKLEYNKAPCNISTMCGWHRLTALSISICLSLLGAIIVFFFASERCLINANVSRYNFTQHYPLYECRLLAVDYPLLPSIRLHARTHTSHAMPKCVYKMQFLSLHSCFVQIVCAISIQLDCIVLQFFFSSSPFCYFLSMH